MALWLQGLELKNGVFSHFCLDTEKKYFMVFFQLGQMLKLCLNKLIQIQPPSSTDLTHPPFFQAKLGGRYLKTQFLATRGPKMKKPRADCLLELLKIKRWTRKKNWFLTFLTPHSQNVILAKKRHFWPLEGQNRKNRGHIHMSILYMKILYDMKF